MGHQMPHTLSRHIRRPRQTLAREHQILNLPNDLEAYEVFSPLNQERPHRTAPLITHHTKTRPIQKTLDQHRRAGQLWH